MSNDIDNRWAQILLRLWPDIEDVWDGLLPESDDWPDDRTAAVLAQMVKDGVLDEGEAKDVAGLLEFDQ